MILLLSKGESFSEVSRSVGKARRIVYKWANRFLEKRMAGLQDLPRSGRPARFSILRRKRLRAPNFVDLQDLAEKIQHFINE